MRELDFHNWMLKIKNKYYANDKLMDLAFERIRGHEKV